MKDIDSGNDTKRPAGKYSNRGFTLVELLISLAIAGVVMGGILTVMVQQRRIYRIQIQTATLQQNLRAAMQTISQDVQMAGYYTSIDDYIYPEYLDWDPRNPGADEMQTVIQGVDNLNSISHYAQGTDSILIVKAGAEEGRLGESDQALAGSSILVLDDLDVNGDNDADFTNSSRPFGILVKSDLNAAQFFKIYSISENTIQVADKFRLTYGEGDIIARADMIVYRIDDAHSAYDGPVLERKNMGKGNQFLVVAEYIENLQLYYILADGNQVDAMVGADDGLRAVRVVLTATCPGGIDGPITKTLESVIQVRNHFG